MDIEILNTISEEQKHMLYLYGVLDALKRKGAIDCPDYLTDEGKEAYEQLISSGFRRDPSILSGALAVLMVNDKFAVIDHAAARAMLN